MTQVEKPGRPADQSATFQHEPDGPLKREWEPGCQPDEVYDQVLPFYRAIPRRWLVQRLREEKDRMAEFQRRVRTPLRDRFFYWTAIFGTHTFFVAILPLFYFFGNPERGRGLLYIVSLGVYVSSFSKDLMCTPRPYSPPAIRISMSTHHNEYGFPSSHSTNSVSIALFLAECLWDIRDSAGTILTSIGFLVLFIYTFSVVFGRVYTGMHSTADIYGGSIMGVSCWLFWLYIKNASDAWVESGTLWVPTIVIPVALALVHYHPEPVDDCPCFEDAIAVLSCSTGGYIAHWQESRSGILSAAYASSYGVAESGPFWGTTIALYRVVLGLAIMAGTRIITKATLLTILPSVFRFTSQLFDFELPTRRFYTAATDYNQVPQSPIHAVPSVLDLHTVGTQSEGTTPMNGTPFEDTPSSSGRTTPVPPTSHTLAPPVNTGIPGDSGLRSRGPSKATSSTFNGQGPTSSQIQDAWVSRRERKSKAERAKYDAEVLTKVGVYGILGYIGTMSIPLLFGIIEGRARQ